MKQINSVIHHSNGGIEQGILEAVQNTQGLTVADAARLMDLQSQPQNRTEVRNTYNLMEKKDIGVAAKIRFASYLETLGYKIVPGTINESRAGVTAQISQRVKPNIENFTEVSPINPIKWFVRLAVKDYDNTDITEGKF